jgi:antitoxin HicB
MTKVEGRIAEIKRRPYTRILIPEADGTWFVKIAELPGCLSAGPTVIEAMANIDDAMNGWLAVMIEDGDAIPAPTAEEYSGKTVVRLGKSLHRLAVEAAERDGVSLNHFITTQVARGVGISGLQHV